MEKLKLKELAEAVGGTLLEPADPETEILSVVTDSRKIMEGCVFFALAGERFDGHAYVDASLQKGAAGCVVSRAPENLLPGRFYVLVGDTRRALGDLARYYRMKFPVKVVGITGSVGKTTCREMMAAVLSRHFRVHATKGNFNNEIGLPMTIFDLSAQDEVMVLEMGMNHLGEIRRLSQIAAPDIAVITNIGTAHIGNLGSRENIFLAKKEIFEGMQEGACAVLCGDDDFLSQIAQDPVLSSKYRLLFAGKGAHCQVRVTDARMVVTGVDSSASEAEMTTVCTIRLPGGIPVPESRVTAHRIHDPAERRPEPSEKVPEDRLPGGGTKLTARIPAAGFHLLYPASLAAAVGTVLGMSPQEIREGIESFSGQRMACEKIGDILLFDDTYNASPDSMRSSLEVLACLPVKKKAAVLGDMLEQGDFAEKLHREVGTAAAGAGIDTLLTIGPLSMAMAEAAREAGLSDVREFPDRESAVSAVEEITRPGTAILFKASHSMALDRLAAVSRRKAQGYVPV